MSSFSSKYFKISHETSALTHVLLRSMLFNLQEFGGLQAIFLLQTSNFTVVWQQILCDSSSFKFTKVGFMSQNVIYIGECFMWA